jgi:hypothetical protein
MLPGLLLMMLTAGPVTEASVAGGIGRLARPGWSVQLGVSTETPGLELSLWARYRAERFFDVLPRYQGLQVFGSASARLTSWCSVGVATEAWEPFFARQPVTFADALSDGGPLRFARPPLRLGMGPAVSMTWRPSNTMRLRLRAAWLPVGTAFALGHQVSEAEFAWAWFIAPGDRQPQRRQFLWRRRRRARGALGLLAPLSACLALKTADARAAAAEDAGGAPRRRSRSRHPDALANDRAAPAAASRRRASAPHSAPSMGLRGRRG